MFIGTIGTIGRVAATAGAPAYQTKYSTAQKGRLNTSGLGFTSVTTPTSGSNDDGFFTIPLPFPFSFPDNNSLSSTVAWTTVYVATNGYISFKDGSAAYSSLSSTNPPVPHLFFGAGDHSARTVLYGMLNGVFVIQVQGNGNSSGSTAPAFIDYYLYPDGRMMVVMSFDSTSDGVNWSNRNGTTTADAYSWFRGVANPVVLGTGIDLNQKGRDAGTNSWSAVYHTTDNGQSYSARDGSYTD